MVIYRLHIMVCISTFIVEFNSQQVLFPLDAEVKVSSEFGATQSVVVSYHDHIMAARQTRLAFGFASSK